MDNFEVTKSFKALRTYYGLVRAAFYLSLVLLIASGILLVFLSFAAEDDFTAVKDANEWDVVYNVSDSLFFSCQIPYMTFQSFGSAESFDINPKTLYLTYFIFHTIVCQLIILFCIDRIVRMLKSAVKEKSPFVKKNVSYLRQIGGIIMVQTFFHKPLVSWALHGIVAHIFSVNITTENFFNGLFLSLIACTLAEIFNYGLFLQGEFDTTL